MNLSKKSLELLTALFSETSNMQLPVSVTEQVLEIREWVKGQLADGK